LNDKYEAFLDLCKANGLSSWPYLFDKIIADSPFAYLALLDLTLPEKASVLDAIRAASTNERYTASAKYIVPSSKANVLNFVKALLAEM
jgi:hypothetical protein